jgi:hypothetical protein
MIEAGFLEWAQLIRNPSSHTADSVNRSSFKNNELKKLMMMDSA